MTSLIKATWACVAVVCLAGLTGCGKKIWINQQPAFYNETMRGMGVAVMPFRNQTNDRNAASALTQELAAAMMGNDTYKVYDREHLKELLNEQDWQIAMGSDPQAAAAKFKKMGNVQAIMVGSVTTYGWTTRTEPRQVADYATDRNGNVYVAGYHTEYFTRNEANVAASAALIRVSDGSTIYATPQPILVNRYVQGSPPNLDGIGVLAVARGVAVSQLVESFACVRKQVTVYPNKDLRTAVSCYDAKWDYQDTFGAQDEYMQVYVHLPPECDRNHFRLAVVRADQREDLASRELVWARNDSAHGVGYEFSPAKIAAAGGGPGDYTVKLYAGDAEPALTWNFKIVSGAVVKKRPPARQKDSVAVGEAKASAAAKE